MEWKNYNIHKNIRFTMEIEMNRSLTFLDVLVTKKPNGSLGHSVYRKPTHIDLCLHAKSHHHPSQKHAVLAVARQYVTQNV
jgi:hypothetical protein